MAISTQGVGLARSTPTSAKPVRRFDSYGQVDPHGLGSGAPHRAGARRRPGTATPGPPLRPPSVANSSPNTDHAGTAPPRRNPALDGYRGAALVGMMAWHAGIESVRGGFARMTIFFVLSGFLATLSYQRMWVKGSNLTGPDQSVSIGATFRQFWARRARRLLPVTAVGLVASIGYTLGWGTADMVKSLRGDVYSVVGYVSNWRFVSSGRSYSELFERPSALQHYWTLSLEEQCFLILPPLLGLIAKLSGGRRRAETLMLLGLVIGLGFWVPFLFEQSPDTVYYGTHVRGAEFIVGVLAARWLVSTGGSTVENDAPRWMRFAGAVSLAVLVGVMVGLDRSHTWLYRGGMVFFAVPAALTLLAALDPRTLVYRVLRFEPLAVLGRWAFPIYLLHWPIFQYLDRQVDLARNLEIVIGFVLSIAIGGMVHRTYELPLMNAARSPERRLAPEQWLLPDRRLFVGTALATGLIVAAAHLPPANPVEVSFDAAEAQAALRSQIRASGALNDQPTPTTDANVRVPEPSQRPDATTLPEPAASERPDGSLPGIPIETAPPDQDATPATDWDASVREGNLAALALTPETAAGVLAAPARPRPPDTGHRVDGQNRRMAMFGDSTALAFGLAMNRDLVSDHFDWGVGFTDLGCAIMRGLERPADEGVFLPAPICEAWDVMYPAVSMESSLEVAGVLFGPGDTYPVRAPMGETRAGIGSDRWYTLDEPVVVNYLKTEMQAMVDTLHRGGVSTVALFTLPVVTLGVEGDGWTRRSFGEHHIAWIEAYNNVMAEVSETTPGVVVVDYANHVASLTEEDANELLFDGVHVRRERAGSLLAEVLLPQMIEALATCTDCTPTRAPVGVAEPGGIAAPDPAGGIAAPVPAGGTTAPVPAGGTTDGPAR